LSFSIKRRKTNRDGEKKKEGIHTFHHQEGKRRKPLTPGTQRACRGKKIEPSAHLSLDGEKRGPPWSIERKTKKGEEIYIFSPFFKGKKRGGEGPIAHQSNGLGGKKEGTVSAVLLYPAHREGKEGAAEGSKKRKKKEGRRLYFFTTSSREKKKKKKNASLILAGGR